MSYMKTIYTDLEEAELVFYGPDDESEALADEMQSVNEWRQEYDGGLSDDMEGAR